MHTDPQFVEAQLTRRRPMSNASSVIAIIAACALFVFGWHWQVSYSMAQTWWTSETYAHGMLVLPIFFYLVWRVRNILTVTECKPYPPAAAAIAFAGFVLLAGQLGSAVGVTQFAVVAMLPLSIWALCGTRIMHALAFPMVFLFFMVPFGEVLLPWLMTWTADFTVAALRITGIPVYREGMSFIIPSGAWSVVEACSGLRYLIAALMVGSLYAYLTYRTRRRRLVFIGLSVVVPIIANWLRAYMIVMLGHFSGNKLATGVDHLIYGWVFFGAIMLLMFSIGGRWREDQRPIDADKVALRLPAAPLPFRAIGFTAIFLLACMIPWSPVATALNEPLGNQVALEPISTKGDWAARSGTLAGWRPDYDKPSAELQQVFDGPKGEVGLYIGYYRDQSQAAELVNINNALVTTRNRRWDITHRVSASMPAGAAEVEAQGAALRSVQQQRLFAWQWFWVDGRLTANRYMAKVYLVLAKLRGHGDDSAVVVIYAPHAEFSTEPPEILTQFAAEMGDNIQAQLTATQRAGKAR
ncbi:MAG TPA: exosortase A [Burkholderiales bacterium]|nr:exosortase A [Burkholderiales bacterium]